MLVRKLHHLLVGVTGPFVPWFLEHASRYFEACPSLRADYHAVGIVDLRRHVQSLPCHKSGDHCRGRPRKGKGFTQATCALRTESCCHQSARKNNARNWQQKRSSSNAGLGSQVPGSDQVDHRHLRELNWGPGRLQIMAAALACQGECKQGRPRISGQKKLIQRHRIAGVQVGKSSRLAPVHCLVRSSSRILMRNDILLFFRCDKRCLSKTKFN